MALMELFPNKYFNFSKYAGKAAKERITVNMSYIDPLELFEYQNLDDKQIVYMNLRDARENSNFVRVR
jgi:hypothetical protein